MLSHLCLVSMCLYALQTLSGHATDDLADGVLGELLSDLDEGINEILDCGTALVAADAVIHSISGVLDWITLSLSIYTYIIYYHTMISVEFGARPVLSDGTIN